MDKKTLLLLINSFVFSKLFYCSSVWGNTSKRNLHKLQLVQNFAARVVLGLKKFDRIPQGRRSLKWLDVTEKVLFNDLVLVFKCVNGLAPDYLGKILLNVQQFTTRTQGDVTILWSPDVDYQWDKGHFIFGVQRNGMGSLTILGTLKILTVNFKRRLFNRIFHTK